MTFLLALLLAADSAVAGMQPVAGIPTLLESGMPQVPADLRERVAQYVDSRAAILCDVADDGSAVLISTRFGSTNQLHLVEAPLGMRTQLTFGDEPITEARFQPGDRNVIWFLRDVRGGEFYQVYRFDRRKGRAELVTDGKSRFLGLTPSHDGARLAFNGTPRNGKDVDVYVADAKDPKSVRRVTEQDGEWFPHDFSRDGSQLLVDHTRSILDADLFTVDLASGGLRQITPKDGKAGVWAAAFTADGKGAYVVTDRYGDFAQLVRMVPGQEPFVMTGDVRWDVDRFVESDDGSRLAVEFNQDGTSRVEVIDARSGKREAVPLPKNAVVSSLRFPRKRPDLLALALQTATEPADVYMADLRTHKLTRWTRSETGGLDPATFVDAQLVRYGSVPAFLYEPKNVQGKLPVVIVWHGGPEGQSRPTFSPFAQTIAAELHMAVLLPNVRGSSGYGKAYLAADDGVKREEALKDIGATLDFIAQRPELDASRVGVYGGSYGGYMTLATAAFYGGRIRAAVDVVGISNLATFLEHTQAYRRDLRRAEYGDERDPAVRAVQERISPLNSVQKIEAAMFVIQGHNDPRVPQSEAEQIVQALRSRGKDVWYLLGLNEGHGFQKRENRDFASAAAAFFLAQQLR